MHILRVVQRNDRLVGLLALRGRMGRMSRIPIGNDSWFSWAESFVLTYELGLYKLNLILNITLLRAK